MTPATSPDEPQAEPAGDGGVLFVVATPIGNLGDVTLRALEVLREAPLIAAEDTRLTRRLLVRHHIDGRLTSYHARSGRARTRALLDHLRRGADLALVSDAGTPTVSDPGADLVAAWADEGGRVVPIPGPSSVLAAVAAAGLVGPRWSFEGFLPRTGRDRRERLAAIAGDGRGWVLFEAPGRVRSTLRGLAAACGTERPAAVCRELTKLHEQIVRGTLGSLVEAIVDGSVPERGEFVVVIGMVERAPVGRAVGPDDTNDETTEEDAAVAAALAAVDRLVAGGTARGDAARKVARETGIPRRRLYRAVP